MFKNFVIYIKNYIVGIYKKDLSFTIKGKNVNKENQDVNEVEPFLIEGLMKIATKKTSDQHSNEDMNEIDEEISEIIKKIQDETSETIKNNINKISDKIKTKINDSISEILQKILIKISIKMPKSSYIHDVDNILSTEISTDTLLTIETQPTTELQLSTKIHLFKEMKFPKIKEIIFAEIHIKIVIILLNELFNISIEKFFDPLKKKILSIIKKKTLTYRQLKSEIIFTEISNKIKKEVSNKIQEKIEEYFNEILRNIYGKMNESDDIKKAFNEQTEIFNEIKTDHSVINYNIDKIQKIFTGAIKEKIHDIKKIFSDTMKEKLYDIESSEKKSLVDDIHYILFIIFAIFDSETLILLYNIAEYFYIKKIAKKKWNINVENYVKKFVAFRVLAEIIFNIPLIVIMVCQQILFIY
ncbi:5074_t:CDS:1 [Gigaspora margarita]|uniref:5074_t:CDS:1 n=1 Tax=Gigaspora margarita TaxID=4874 RepID=A0ABM8W0C1_GIGMA|nr:5074_t:CDS:1 [Gigaspora margarita]